MKLNRRLFSLRTLSLAIGITALCACSTSPRGRTQLTTPVPVGNVYSSVDMQINLATSAGKNVSCMAEECALEHAFNQQVQSWGARLAKSAFATYPELSERVNHFEFVVAEKEKPGSTSNASGSIVIFRGVQKLHPDENTLAFLIGREMGHVIARHHHENAAPRLILTVVTTLLFPAAHLFQGSAALANTTSLTASATAATAAASTATSLLGSQLILAGIKPGQLSEADAIAMELLVKSGGDRHEVASALESYAKNDDKSIWMQDLRTSAQHAQLLAAEIMTADIAQEEVLPASQETLQETSALAHEALQQADEGTLTAQAPDSTTTPALDSPITSAANNVATSTDDTEQKVLASIAGTQDAGVEPASPQDAAPILIATAAKLALPAAAKVKSAGNPRNKVIAKGKTTQKSKLAKVRIRTKTASRHSPLKTARVSTQIARPVQRALQRTALKLPLRQTISTAQNNVKSIRTAGTTKWPNSAQRE